MRDQIHTGIYSRVPSEFSTDLAKLPPEFWQSMGMVSQGSARLELFLALLINNVDFLFDKPTSLEPLPYKAGERINWLSKAFELTELAPVKDMARDALRLAAAVNAARNDITHNAILGYAEDGRLYVANVKSNRKGTIFELQEGVEWTISDVGKISSSIEQVNQKILFVIQAVKALSSNRSRRD